MPDVPRLLHPGHPESPDDRPEQPGDGQEHPARVCLHPLHGTHRHIVTPGFPPPPFLYCLCLHSVPLSWIAFTKHFPAGPQVLAKRLHAAFTSYQKMHERDDDYHHLKALIIKISSKVIRRYYFTFLSEAFV